MIGFQPPSRSLMVLSSVPSTPLLLSKHYLKNSDQTLAAATTSDASSSLR